jgi:parallel beta-helix repeat protein
MRHAARALLIALALVATFGGALLAEPCTITVQPGESIQAAIDAAPEGAWVCLPAGEWEEHITIGKRLTLKGAGAEETTIRGHREDRPVIRVLTADEDEGMVFLEGVGLTGGIGMYGPGLLIEGASSVIVIDCAVFENGYGIRLTGTARAAIHGTRVFENAASGIWLADNSQSTLTYCTVAGNAFSGIWITGEAESVVHQVTTQANREGIRLSGSSRARIEGSRVIENRGRGLWMDELATLSISGSRVAGSGREGIYLSGSVHATLETNVIAEGQLYGVGLYERPCIATDTQFSGYIAGFGNTIPGPDEEGGNVLGAVCPDELAFLTTEEGGALDRRE